MLLCVLIIKVGNMRFLYNVYGRIKTEESWDTAMAFIDENAVSSRKKRWNAFYALDGRKSFMIVVEYEGGVPARPHLWPSRKRERIEWVLRKYEDLCGRARWLNDDTVPYLDMLTGTEVFAEAFGCRVHRPEDDMPFARPLVRTAAEAARIRVPDLENSSLSLLFEIADEAREKAGGDAVLRLPDIQSPMDIAALIWDKNDFYAALREDPGAVKELAAKVYALLTAFLDKWFARYGRDFVAHFPANYMPQGLTLSEDEVGCVSPAAFREFFLPELSALSLRYGGLGMHCCANSRHQWDNFKALPGLRFLNLCQSGEVVDEAVRFFADFTAQEHFEAFSTGRYFGGRPVWEWPEMVPEGVHMVLNAGPRTREEALEVCEKLNRACGRS